MIEHTPGEMSVTVQVDGFWVVPGQGVSGKDCGGNWYLITNAHEAPHECSDPDCPGDVNRRKLAVFDGLLYVCEAYVAHFAGLPWPTAAPEWGHLNDIARTVLTAIAQDKEQTAPDAQGAEGREVMRDDEILHD